ncbi:MAG TPA: copper homeostasis membrane protein CopD [Xanthobacteraceae bacterium]
MTDPLIYARALHFAATILVAGVALFFVFLAAPALPKNDATGGVAALRGRLQAIAWISLALCLLSGAAWLLLTAQSMSGQPFDEVLSQGVIWTVLARTEFGNDWLLRLVVAVLLAAALQALLPAQRNASRGVAAAAVVLAATLVGSLAWAGHAIGASGIEGIIHPIADVLHLIAAAAWVGTLPLLVLLLAMALHDPTMAAMAQSATLRFSTLGILSVGTLLATGIVNSWYLVGSVTALTGTTYGRLLSIKIGLFLAMVAIAAVNRLRLTPRLLRSETAAVALHPLRRNAAIETLFGVLVVIIVAAMGTKPPASHAHHPVYGGLPADAAFVHIHSEQGMADVTIIPGRVGTAHATIRLWDADFGPLEARQVTFALTAPAAGSEPIRRAATEDADGAWQVDDIALSGPGNWIATVDAGLGPSNHLVLKAPIVIDPEP